MASGEEQIRARYSDLVFAHVVRWILRAEYGPHAWYRAGVGGRSLGEPAVLASLHDQGLLQRRAWRGVEGKRFAAYEYRPHDGALARALLDRARGRLQNLRRCGLPDGVEELARSISHERVTESVAMEAARLVMEEEQAAAQEGTP